MNAPNRHRRILLAVTGLSPQVVTETLYALAVPGKVDSESWVPTEVRLITTAEGAERARLALLHPQSGWFHRLCADYSLPDIRFTESHIHVLSDADGQPLNEIRTPAENTFAADFITGCVRDLTQYPSSTLHVSIAGGRKTMGFYLGYALSLYGRQQDGLSHVLVNQPFESHPEFFYPSPDSQLIQGPPPMSRLYDRKDAVVTLARIPFVRMRDELSEALLAGKSTFSQAVAEAQSALVPIFLELDPASCSITAAGRTFKIEAALFAFYWMMAERALAGKGGLSRFDDAVREGILTYSAQLMSTASSRYEHIEKHLRDDGTSKSMDYRTKRFDQNRSKIKRKLLEELGERQAAPYLIHRVGRVERSTRGLYGLKLDSSAIRIIGARN